MTVSPAARRSSKLTQPFIYNFQLVNETSTARNTQMPHTRLLTINVEFCALLCFPCVIKSNFSFGLPLQSCIAIGIKFSLKSPAAGFMKRHCPFEALRDTPVNALVAVLSNCWASAAALGCNSPPARETGTGVVGLKFSTPEAAGISVVIT